MSASYSPQDKISTPGVRRWFVRLLVLGASLVVIPMMLIAFNTLDAQRLQCIRTLGGDVLHVAPMSREVYAWGLLPWVGIAIAQLAVTLRRIPAIGSICAARWRLGVAIISCEFLADYSGAPNPAGWPVAPKVGATLSRTVSSSHVSSWCLWCPWRFCRSGSPLRRSCAGVFADDYSQPVGRRQRFQQFCQREDVVDRGVGHRAESEIAAAPEHDDSRCAANSGRRSS